jgi:hypothetical protein
MYWIVSGPSKLDRSTICNARVGQAWTQAGFLSASSRCQQKLHFSAFFKAGLYLGAP